MMVTTSTGTKKSTNRLDAMMTKTQVVRRKFKSALPRVIENRVLSPMEAMAKTMELFDKLRNEMEAAGLKRDDAYAGLVYHQPDTKGMGHVLGQTIALPKPGDIRTFVDKVMKLDKPRFLGVLFLQHDPDAEKAEYQNVVFVWPFLDGPDDAARLIAARNSQASLGRKKAN